MEYSLETTHLRLRQFTRTDAPFILELLNSPGWLQFIGDRNVKTEQQAVQYLENGPIASYALHGWGLGLVELKEDNTPVGMCGILKRPTLEHPELGFAFLPDYGGKGYALEIADATLKHAKDTLGMATISAITLAQNTRSIRLLEKLGFTFVSTLSGAGSEEELLLYRC